MIGGGLSLGIMCGAWERSCDRLIELLLIGMLHFIIICTAAVAIFCGTCVSEGGQDWKVDELMSMERSYGLQRLG